MPDEYSPIGLQALASVLSVLSLFVGLILCALIVGFYSRRHGRPLIPALFPAIPLFLIAICIQVFACVLVVLDGFNQIATAKTSGVVAVSDFIIKSQQFLLWRVVEVAVCVLAVALVQIFRTVCGMDADSSPAQASATVKPPLNWITAGLVFLAIAATAYLVWGCSDINHLIVLLIDPSKEAEANARVGNMDIDAVTSYITRHLMFFAAAALNVILGLIALGIHSVEDDRPRRYDLPVSALLALLLLGLSTASIVGSLRSVKYLRSLMISYNTAPPSWTVGLVPFAEYESRPQLAAPTQPDNPAGAGQQLEPPSPPPPPPPPPPSR